MNLLQQADLTAFVVIYFCV